MLTLGFRHTPANGPARTFATQIAYTRENGCCNIEDCGMAVADVIHVL